MSAVPVSVRFSAKADFTIESQVYAFDPKQPAPSNYVDAQMQPLVRGIFGYNSHNYCSLKPMAGCLGAYGNRDGLARAAATADMGRSITGASASCQIKFLSRTEKECIGQNNNEPQT
jgi:hypothetical protein